MLKFAFGVITGIVIGPAVMVVLREKLRELS
jgi:hypothetical protein